MCGRLYRSPSSRSAHERVHSFSTACHICGRFLGKMGNLKRHLISRHGLDSDEASELLRQRVAAQGEDRGGGDSALERLMYQL